MFATVHHFLNVMRLSGSLSTRTGGKAAKILLFSVMYKKSETFASFTAYDNTYFHIYRYMYSIVEHTIHTPWSEKCHSIIFE